MRTRRARKGWSDVQAFASTNAAAEAIAEQQALEEAAAAAEALSAKFQRKDDGSVKIKDSEQRVGIRKHPVAP